MWRLRRTLRTAAWSSCVTSWSRCQQRATSTRQRRTDDNSAPASDRSTTPSNRACHQTPASSLAKRAWWSTAGHASGSTRASVTPSALAWTYICRSEFTVVVRWCVKGSACKPVLWKQFSFSNNRLFIKIYRYIVKNMCICKVWTCVGIQ